MPVLDVGGGRFPAGIGRGTAIVLEVLGALRRSEIGETQIQTMSAGEDRTVLAVARYQDAGVRVLHASRPDGDVTEAIEPSLPAERLRLGEARLQQQDPFFVPITRLPRVGAVRE